MKGVQKDEVSEVVKAEGQKRVVGPGAVNSAE